MDSANENSIIGNKQIVGYLLETSKWAKFLAIIGYVGIGIIVLMALFASVIFSSLSQTAQIPFPSGVFTFIYLLIAVCYYFPVAYLYKFSQQMKKGLTSGDTNAITLGFENLKSHYKFMGIFMIVVLSLYGVIFVFGFLFSMLRF